MQAWLIENTKGFKYVFVGSEENANNKIDYFLYKEYEEIEEFYKINFNVKNFVEYAAIFRHNWTFSKIESNICEVLCYDNR